MTYKQNSFYFEKSVIIFPYFTEKLNKTLFARIIIK